ncbi:MAG: hypothetical protein EBR82_61060 [Caulobacteraceae bacterium]|nr:hypothetical protein [Caulobacteraceae bacterium]
MLGPVAPILYVPAVILFEIVEFVAVSDITERVPIVAVPVDAVIFDPNVTAPNCNGIVAVETMVDVPVDAVRLVPNVTIPERRLVPSTASVPVLFTPVVESWSAVAVSFPPVMF